MSEAEIRQEAERVKRARWLVPILMVVAVCAFVLGIWAVLSARHATCSSRDATGDLMRDIVIIASTPGGTSRDFTLDQLEKRNPRIKVIVNRIDQIRC